MMMKNILKNFYATFRRRHNIQQGTNDIKS